MKIVLVCFLFFSAAGSLLAASDGAPEQFENDVKKYISLLRQDRDNPKHLNALGFAYCKLRRLPEAVEALTRSITIDPKYPVSYNNLGTAYLNLQEPGKAETAFRKTLSLDPHYVKAAYNLSVALFRQKKYVDAYKAYQAAKRIDARYVQRRFEESSAREQIVIEAKKNPQLVSDAIRNEKHDDN